MSNITTLRDLKEGDRFRLAYEPENRIRTLSQKGRIEGYCPYDGQNTMGHSKGGGEEVFILSTVVIPIEEEPSPSTQLHTEEGFTKGEWECSPVFNFSDTLVSYISSKSGKPVAQLRGCTNGEEKEAEANAHLIAAAKDMYFVLKELANDHTASSYWNKRAESLIKKANPKL